MCNNVKNLRVENYSFKNSFCSALMFALSEVFESTDVLMNWEKIEELKKEEIFELFGLNNDDYETILRQCLLSNIKNGVSEFCIVTLDPVIAKRVCEELEIFGSIYLRAQDLRSYDLKKLTSEFKKSNFRLGIYVDPYFVGDELTSEVSDICGKHKLPVLITLFDDLQKTGMLNSIFDCLPISYIEKLGLLDRECSIYGCVCADKEDFNIISSYNAKVIISPYESMNFGKGAPNVFGMLNAGVKVELSSPCLFDILKEVEFTSVLSRGILSDPNILSLEEVLELGLSKHERVNFDEEKAKANEQKFYEITQRIKEKI